MTEGEAHKNPDTSQGQEASIAEEDFASLFEESLQAVQPGGVVTGRVVDINPTHVVVDVGYKTEGRISVQEFQDREGALQVNVGDDVDVFFESPEGDRGEIVLSRLKAESIKVWDRIKKAYEEVTPVEGIIVADEQRPLQLRIRDTLRSHGLDDRIGINRGFGIDRTGDINLEGCCHTDFQFVGDAHLQVLDTDQVRSGVGGGEVRVTAGVVGFVGALVRTETPALGLGKRQRGVGVHGAEAIL